MAAQGQMREFVASKGMAFNENGGLYVRGQSYDDRKRMEVFLGYETIKEKKSWRTMWLPSNKNVHNLHLCGRLARCRLSGQKILEDGAKQQNILTIYSHNLQDMTMAS